MDPTLPLGVSIGIGSLLYIIYLVKGTQEFHEEPPQSIPILLPEQAVSVHQPKPNIAIRIVETYKELKAEKEMKALPPLEKVRYIAPEEEEWALLPEEEEPKDTTPDQNGIVPIDQLESHNKVAYYEVICSIIEKVDNYYEKHGKVIRDGLVPAIISRRDWDHTCKKGGVLWLSGFLSEDALGVTIVHENGGQNLHEWFKARGYNIADPEGYVEEKVCCEN